MRGKTIIALTVIGAMAPAPAHSASLESDPVSRFRRGAFAAMPDRETRPDVRASARLIAIAEKYQAEDASARSDVAGLASRSDEEQVAIDAERVAELTAFIGANGASDSALTAVLLIGAVVQGTEKKAHDAALQMLQRVAAEHAGTWQGRVAPLLTARLVCDGRRTIPEEQRIRSALAFIPIAGSTAPLPERDPEARIALRMCKLEPYGGSIERMVLASHVAGNWRLYRITEARSDLEAAKSAAQRLASAFGSGRDVDLARRILATTGS